MVDTINKIFAILAKAHAVVYMLVGGIFTAFLYLNFIDYQVHKISLMRIGNAGIFIMVTYFILSRYFYEKYELGKKYLPMTNTGMVKRDTFFYTKINSNITSSRKLVGYLYVVFRIGANIFFGFTLFAILFFGLKKGLGV
ncbi:MAG: hypothetical protein CVV46_16950 [Spirochaetae bacterium HGW-Spirochaetae-2]|nr:MAG: hypothetical protein CVV46_16950 [Spirochaetae bacterium HGW-Spirochaetae-2]PKO92248.1 MAG: hypothetical protein CVU15_07710 [Betaproteobacteria bacterium HGW-Betaproteobacteria-1]